ncbi:MAG: AraC family transcriptional regulator [Pseudomonadales bacterium]|nr:AraC family transcriptional regulator [Pseudomonadales bacterium]|tara:strand:- start:3129 stop:4163 length:1035 start_codon:yes stop_codon:yes gene_type:complete
MSSDATWLDIDSRVILAGHQPACLIDLALGRGIDSHRLLRGSGLFYEDLLLPDTRLSAAQYLRLLDNARTLLDAADSSFLLGQRLLPGHYGAASNLLLHADTLLQALERLASCRALLSPLLAPRLHLDDHHVYLYWRETFGLGRNRRFLLEAGMTAVTSLGRSLVGQALPWEYQLGWAQPDYVEQYWVHMGERLRFEAPVSCMRLPREYVVRKPMAASAMLEQIAAQQTRQILQGLPASDSLSEAVFDHLYLEGGRRVGQEQVADHFMLSAATFKRRLQRDGTGFQSILDSVHAQRALELYQSRGYSHDQVAANLQVSDRTNFRRLLKRLTGKSPDSLRIWLES